MSDLVKVSKDIANSIQGLNRDLVGNALIQCIVGNIRTDKQLSDYLGTTREQAFLIMNNPEFSNILVEAKLSAQKTKFVLTHLTRLNNLTKSTDHKVALGAIKLLSQLTGILKDEKNININISLEQILEDIEKEKKETIINITPKKDEGAFTLDDCFGD